jgi:hypothetical protein
LTPACAMTRKVPANRQSGAMRKTVNSMTAALRSLRTKVTRRLDLGPCREIQLLEDASRRTRAGL